MDLISSNAKFKQDLDRKYSLEQYRFRQGYGANLREKQKQEFEKYLENYMANTSRHINLIRDSYQRKMSFSSPLFYF